MGWCVGCRVRDELRTVLAENVQRTNSVAHGRNNPRLVRALLVEIQLPGYYKHKRALY